MTTKRNRALPNFTIRGKRKAKAAPPPACPVVRPKMRKQDRELFEKIRTTLKDVESALLLLEHPDVSFQIQGARLKGLMTDIDNALAAAKP